MLFCVFYGDCVVVGTCKVQLPVLNVDVDMVVAAEEHSHKGAMWNVDVYNNCAATVTGGAGRTVVSWNLEDNKEPTRVLEVGEEVVPAQYRQRSGEKRLVFVMTLNFNVQFFFQVSTYTGTNYWC